MQAYEQYLGRWRKAGVLDDATESAIRQYEEAQVAPGGQRWQVILALVLGGILLGAGVLLFVAAHWDDVSPLGRLLLVMAMLAAFHVSGIVSRERFPGFATTMHALGTVASGAAIALVGQIFNMQEHWPAAILLWALCAAAGWWLLGDEFQQSLALLLAPAWLISEWSYRATVYNGSNVFLWRMIAVVGAVYLLAFVHSRRRVVAGLLFAAASVALVVSTAMLAEGWGYNAYGREQWGAVPMSLQIGAYLVMALTLAAGTWAERRSALPMAAVALMSISLPWLQTVISSGTAPYIWRRSEPDVAMYALVAAVCVFLAWWGVREGSKAVVNFGIAAFALTVMWFYFSSIMDKLGRSLGLIGLGMLFLAGGWLLEQTRRRLVAKIAEVAL